jgi:hypothetical protein
VKGCTISAYARRSGPLDREGSLSCYTYCETGPRFFRSHPIDRPIQSPFTTCMGMWRIYSNLDPHGSPISRLSRHTRGCGGPILTRILIGQFIDLVHVQTCQERFQIIYNYLLKSLFQPYMYRTLLNTVYPHID